LPRIAHKTFKYNRLPPVSMPHPGNMFNPALGGLPGGPAGPPERLAGKILQKISKIFEFL
jgi:hypothetical protein